MADGKEYAREFPKSENDQLVPPDPVHNTSTIHRAGTVIQTCSWPAKHKISSKKKDLAHSCVYMDICLIQT